ncbi:MAG: glycosyltransferase [Melioribacteraceae bacterium]|nr:glycosyltransferase [Melioribacteraceae bacterium]
MSQKGKNIDLKSIVWLGEAISPYNNLLFEHLIKENNSLFIIYYRYSARKTHFWIFQKKINYKYRYFLKFRFIPDFRAISQSIFVKDNMIVFAGTKGLTKTIILFLAIIFNKDFIYWSDVPPIDHFNGLKGLYREFIFSLIFRRGKKILVTGKPGIQRMIKYGCCEDKLINFPYFVPLPNIITSKNKYYKEKNTLVLLASGRLEYIKGFDIILESLSNLKIYGGIDKIELKIAGEGSYRKILEKKIDDLGIKSSVKLIGWLQQHDLEEFFSSGDIFIHMARFEPFGVVVLEAMSFGKPIIGSDTTMAVLDRVIDGENGFIVKSENVNQLANKIKYFYENREVIESMGNSSRKVAEEWPVEKGVEIIKNISKRSFING